MRPAAAVPCLKHAQQTRTDHRLSRNQEATAARPAAGIPTHFDRSGVRHLLGMQLQATGVTRRLCRGRGAMLTCSAL